MSAWFLNKINSRLHERNKNWLCVVCGETGSGKSYTSLRIAEILDPNFTVDNVVFTASEFMALVNKKGRQGLKKGSIIIWDEAGVEMAAREWHSVKNKIVNYILQTFRYKNLGVIFTTPDFKFIDVQARKLFHTYIEMTHIDVENNVSHMKVMEVQNNPRMGKIYTKFYRQGLAVIESNTIDKPSKKLIDAYEKKKREFADTLSQDIGFDVEQLDINKRAHSNRGILDMLKEDGLIKDYVHYRARKRRVNKIKLEIKFGIGGRRSSQLAEMIKDTEDFKAFPEREPEVIPASPKVALT